VTVDQERQNVDREPGVVLQNDVLVVQKILRLRSDPLPNEDAVLYHLAELEDLDQSQKTEVEIEELLTINHEIVVDQDRQSKLKEAYRQRKLKGNPGVHPGAEIVTEDANILPVPVRRQVRQVALEVDLAAVEEDPHRQEDVIHTNGKDNSNFKNCPQQTRVEIIKNETTKNLFYYLPIVLF